MAGALTHILLGLFAAFAVHKMHFRYEFSMAVFVGNLLPDAIKFGISAIVQGTFLFFKIEKDSLYYALAEVTASYVNWILVLLFVIAFTSLLYHHKYIRKKEMKEVNELWAFLILGILVHTIVDVFIVETNIWI